MRVHRYAAIALCAAVLGSCNELGTQPEPSVATSIQLSASSISILDGSTEQVTAQVLDRDGNAMTGVAVDWTSSDASVAAVSTTGRVSGEHPGSADVTASTGNVSATVAVTVTQVATQLARVTDETQAGTVGETMPDSVEVQVLDRHGLGVPGLEVDFEVVAGDGSVAPTQTVSREDGTARTSWTLGSTAGENTLRISSPALENQAMDLYAVGVAGAASPAASLIISSTSTLQAGQSADLTVEVRDSVGNVHLSGTESVEFVLDEGDGISGGVLGDVQYTGSGRYTASFTGRLAGSPMRVTATLNGETVGGDAVALSVVAGAPSASASVFMSSSTVVEIGKEITLELEVLDDYGNRVTDQNVSFRWTGPARHGGSVAVGTVTELGAGRYGAEVTGVTPGRTLYAEAALNGHLVADQLPVTVMGIADPKEHFVAAYAEEFGLAIPEPAYSWTGNSGVVGGLEFLGQEWTSTAYLGDSLYRIYLFPDGSRWAHARTVRVRPQGTQRVVVVVVDHGNTNIVDLLETDWAAAQAQINADHAAFAAREGYAAPLVRFENTNVVAEPSEIGDPRFRDPVVSFLAGRGITEDDFDLVVSLDLDPPNQRGGFAHMGGDFSYMGWFFFATDDFVTLSPDQLGTIAHAVYHHEIGHNWGWEHVWSGCEVETRIIRSGCWLEATGRQLMTDPVLYGWTDVNGNGVPEILSSNPYGRDP